MLRIRFLRIGKKNRPSYRLVVTPKRSAPQGGRFLELLGFYDPIKHVKDFKKDRVQHWLARGASASDSVHNMLVAEGVIGGEKVSVHKKAKGGAGSEEKSIEGEAKHETPVEPVSSDDTSAKEEALRVEEANGMEAEASQESAKSEESGSGSQAEQSQEGAPQEAETKEDAENKLEDESQEQNRKEEAAEGGGKIEG